MLLFFGDTTNHKNSILLFFFSSAEIIEETFALATKLQFIKQLAIWIIYIIINGRSFRRIKTNMEYTFCG
jgi:hypothetical protein